MGKKLSKEGQQQPPPNSKAQSAQKASGSPQITTKPGQKVPTAKIPDGAIGNAGVTQNGGI